MILEKLNVEVYCSNVVILYWWWSSLFSVYWEMKDGSWITIGFVVWMIWLEPFPGHCCGD